jgi:hypothetical protein
MRGVFQYIIDGYMDERSQRQCLRRLPEVRENEQESNDRPLLKQAAYLLTDLLPTWYYILAKCSEIPTSAKDEALIEYARSVEPYLTSGTGFAEVPLLEALDVLDLPF